MRTVYDSGENGATFRIIDSPTRTLSRTRLIMTALLLLADHAKSLVQQRLTLTQFLNEIDLHRLMPVCLNTSAIDICMLQWDNLQELPVVCWEIDRAFLEPLPDDWNNVGPHNNVNYNLLFTCITPQLCHQFGFFLQLLPFESFQEESFFTEL